MTKAITCLYCGIDGVIETHGSRNDKSLNTFTYLGRNHVSGHLHFQCPACGIVLLVAPALIRAHAPIFAKEPMSYPEVPSPSRREFPGLIITGDSSVIQ